MFSSKLIFIYKLGKELVINIFLKSYWPGYINVLTFSAENH